MSELNPIADGQPGPDQAAFFGDQAARLREQDLSIGSENTDADELADSAHNPATEIDTTEIGCDDGLDDPGIKEEPRPADTETNGHREIGDTSTTKAEILDTFDRWERGEAVRSGSTPVARFEVSDEELAILATDHRFEQIGPSDFNREDIQERTGLTEEQLGVLQELDRRFVDAVAEDAARNGLGQPDERQHVMWIGDYDRDTDGINWHVDALGAPIARYVLSLGEAGSTRFAHGSLHKSQLDDFGDVFSQSSVDNPRGSYQTVADAPGTITRFLANHDIHTGPDGSGFRVFFTTSVPIIRDDATTPKIDATETGYGDNPGDLGIEAGTPELAEPTVPEAAGAVAMAAADVPDALRATDAAAIPAETSDTNEFGDTTLTRDEVYDQFERWERGEVVESAATPIARLEVSNEELAVLQSIPADTDFDIIAGWHLADPGSEDAQQRTGLTERQLQVIADLDERFVAAVTHDAETNGLGELYETHHLVEAGTFRPEDDTLGWHVDRFPDPTIRYVLSLGDAGATRFVQGPIQKDQTNDTGYVHHGIVNTAAVGSHREMQSPAGVVTRFLANRDVHATPDQEGTRVFFTHSVRNWGRKRR
jgi:hypothetical protein